jgi:hypothetical protein
VSRPRHLLRTARRLPVLGASALLLVAGGSGLLAAALSNGPAAADSTLGGFTISALAESISAQYEQPNFPVPATPSLEFDEGYAATSDNFGPNGTAVASSLYPGQVIANAGPQLALLAPGVPLPPAPIWPIEATSEYPQTPNTQSTDQPGVNMDSTSNANGNVASASIGNDAPTAGASGVGVSPVAPSSSGNPFASSSSFVGIGSMSATSSSMTPSTSANADASATVTGISFLGGFINIGSVTSTADAISDGTTGKVTGATVVHNMSIAGTPVTVDAQGIHAQGQSAPLSMPVSSINTLLNELGISIAVNNATDTVNGPSASRTLDGLTMTVDLKTLDNAANQFASLFPPSFTSQLPFALPNDQQLTLDLATVQVQSTASPNFVSGNTGNTGSGGGTASTSPAFTGNTGAGSYTGNTGLGSSFSSPGGGTGGVAPPSGSGTTPQATGPVTPALASAAFKGVGSAAILLGLLAAVALAYLYKRADDATELLTAECADGDPVGERFAASAEDLNQFGG